MHLITLSAVLTLSSLASAHIALDSRQAPHRHHVARRAPASYDLPMKRQKVTPTSDLDQTGTNAGDDEDDDISSAIRTTTRGTVTPTSTIPVTPSVIRSSPLVSSITVSSAVQSTISPSSSSSAPSGSIVSANSTFSANSTSVSSTIVSSAPVTSSAVPTSSASNSVPVMTITEDGGSVKVITKILTAQPSASASSSSSTSDSSGPAISTGAIIGISIAAGAVILALVGFAIWRMKRRGGGNDDAIRWPELNRHGDSNTHHALPARQTGHHGFETGLERSLSNSSSIYRSGVGAASIHSHATSAAPMALNGSNFGAASSLEDYDYNEKQNVPALPPLHHQPGYDVEEDYTNMPPVVQTAGSPNHAYGGYDPEDEGHYVMPTAGYELQQMSGVHAHPATYHGAR